MPRLPIDVSPLVQYYDAPGVRAWTIMGSHARGDAGRYSDVDLVRFVDRSVAETDAYTHRIAGYLVVISTVTPEKVEGWFTEPESAVASMAGVRTAHILVDREGYFAAIQQRARAFVWTAGMQAKANDAASAQMVGWIEEAHKGLEGLRRNDVGRLLQARFGLSWGLSRVVQMQRGVLISGDNAFYAEVAEEIGWESEWVRLRRIAFGIEDAQGGAPTLRQQVAAGLRLYIETAELLADVLRPEDAPLIQGTVEQIEQVLAIEP